MPKRKGSGFAERCLCCQHKDVGRINFALCKGTPPLAVAREYGLNPGSVYGHNRNHIPENYRKIIGSGVYADIDSLLKKCTHGDAESLDILNAAISGTFNAWSTAFANGSQSGMTAHGSQLRQFLELRSKINREIAPSQHYGQITTNILLNGDVSTLLRILQPFPEARAAIVAHYSNAASPQMIEHVAAAD